MTYVPDWHNGVDWNACMGCGNCAANCPLQCITIEDRAAHIDPASCIRCGFCVEYCPTSAIDIT